MFSTFARFPFLSERRPAEAPVPPERVRVVRQNNFPLANLATSLGAVALFTVTLVPPPPSVPLFHSITELSPRARDLAMVITFAFMAYTSLTTGRSLVHYYEGVEQERARMQAAVEFDNEAGDVELGNPIERPSEENSGSEEELLPRAQPQ